MTASATEGLDEALHAAALCDSGQSLCARAVPYLRTGLERAESVVAVTSGEVEQVLRSALGGEAERVHWQGVKGVLSAARRDVRGIPPVPGRTTGRRRRDAAAHPGRR